MANEYTPDLITLISEEGEEIEFEILDIIENEIGKFLYCILTTKIPMTQLMTRVNITFSRFRKLTEKKSLLKLRMMNYSTSLLRNLKKDITKAFLMMKTTKSKFISFNI